MKVKVAFDMDGVLANFTEMFFYIANQTIDRNIPLIDNPMSIKKWGYEEYVSQNQREYVMQYLQNVSNFWETLKQNYYFGYDAKAVSRINNMNRSGKFEFHIITSRFKTVGRSVEEQTLRWLQSTGIDFVPQIIVTDYKYKYINAHNIDVFVDDKDKHIIEAIRNTKCKVFAVDALHNKDEIARTGIPVSVAYTINDVLNYATNLALER